MKSSTFICQLPSDVQLAIGVKVRDYMYREHGAYLKTSAIDECIRNAMDGRLSDVEEIIPIEEVERMMYDSDIVNKT